MCQSQFPSNCLVLGGLTYKPMHPMCQSQFPSTCLVLGGLTYKHMHLMCQRQFPSACLVLGGLTYKRYQRKRPDSVPWRRRLQSLPPKFFSLRSFKASASCPSTWCKLVPSPQTAQAHFGEPLQNAAKKATLALKKPRTGTQTTFCNRWFIPVNEASFSHLNCCVLRILRRH